MLRKLIVLFFSLIILVISACTAPTGEGNKVIIDPSEADFKAQKGFDELPAFVEQVYYVNVAEKITRDFTEARKCEDLWTIDELKKVRDHFVEALSLNPDNGKANLGMAIMDLADLNCYSGIWAILSKILDGDWSSVKYTDMEGVVSADLLPAFEKAMGRLNKTLADSTFTTVTFKDTSDDEHIISRTEVYLFRGALSLVHAFIFFAIAYDFHVVDQYDSYNWISAEENFYRTLKPNFNRNSFLKLRSGKDLGIVLNELKQALDDLKKAHDGIMAQTGDVSKYFIKKVQIADLNQFITENNFLEKNWTDVTQIISWARNLISLQTEESINGQTFQINPANFFANQLADLRSYLPYHQWNGDVVEYLDAPGGNILSEDEYVFPDYTFNGVLPGMTKEKFDIIIH